MSVEIKNLSYTYSAKTPYEKKALNNVSFSVNEGETLGIIGSTGSGKSTLIQHINGLIKLTSGEIKVFDVNLGGKRPDYKKLRSMVGMLFQYPEYQLFEDTVVKDVMFGPLNFGFTKEEAYDVAKESLELVGLNFEEVKDKSPFELSGGQKRRAAIAGVIAYKPKILVLDEPTAGLDPVGKKEMLELVKNLKRGETKTVIMISHNMDEIAEYSDRIVVLSKGEMIADSTPKELFSDSNALGKTGLSLPHTAEIFLKLKEKGFPVSGEVPMTKDALTEAIIKAVGGVE